MRNLTSHKGVLNRQSQVKSRLYRALNCDSESLSGTEMWPLWTKGLPMKQKGGHVTEKRNLGIVVVTSSAIGIFCVGETYKSSSAWKVRKYEITTKNGM